MTEQELLKFIPKEWPFLYGSFAILPGYLPPSLNIMLRLSWIRWQRAKEEEKARKAMHFSGLFDLKKAEWKEKRGLVVIQERWRLLDETNLQGSVKQMEDILRERKILFQDSPMFLDHHVEQVKVGQGKHGTNIIVLAMEPLEGT